MKLVMVDDSNGDRKLCRILLEEKAGSHFDFVEASTGAQGLEICRSASPDCVLLDYKLPDMTGLEFLARLSANSNLESSKEVSRKEKTRWVPTVAVVMLTGLASEEVAVEALKAGAQDYLVKDRITAESLSLTVAKATEKVALIRALEEERDRLAASLAEKDVLLREVHHRVKNNLQVIASLLKLQADGIGDARVTGALRESQHRVESMALIHEQLYETEDLREVDLATHAGLLAANLLHSYGIEDGRIQCLVEVEPLSLSVDQAIPSGLILNELISNALKHGFPGERRGTITISGRYRGGRVTLEVQDDGVGIPPGFDPAKSKSLGLQIIRILSRQLKGSFEIGPGPGAAFCVSFPPAYSGTTKDHANQQVIQSARGGR